ncbi:Ig-like domain-containing protein [Sulfurovum sp. bin170]|uniref:Ig-like domain-containing protein n=1 Tax=Sulfurovum sp. bin170 TaxID=2695268 RepID=UPI0013DFB9E6|nr:Ig-like domain-containing protein [Sulfurovum sp. bin170]NEW61378.1 Ig-like domain-containing protein [Sulfurovum sp. bin170]
MRILKKRKLMSNVLKALKLQVAPNKTFIGKVQKGFDFLGLHINTTGVAASLASIKKRDKKISWLYEQSATTNRIKSYLKRWSRWVAFSFLVIGYVAPASAEPCGYYKIHEMDDGTTSFQCKDYSGVIDASVTVPKIGTGGYLGKPTFYFAHYCSDRQDPSSCHSDYMPNVVTEGETYVFINDRLGMDEYFSVNFSGGKFINMKEYIFTTPDYIAPSGYSVNFASDPVNFGNKASVAFSFTGAEIGTTYEYSIDDNYRRTDPVTGSATVQSTTEAVTNIDVSGLDDDTLTLRAALIDPAGNEGIYERDTVEKDTVLPVVTENTAIAYRSGENTPDYIFNTSESGTLTMGGRCGTSSSTTLRRGTRVVTVTLTQPDNSTALADGTYNDCTITVTDAVGNVNSPLLISSFTVDATTPTAIFDPLSGSTTHAGNANLTITFDEVIRTGGNVWITDANVASLITLTQTDSSGTAVDFTATIDSAKKIITINPIENLIDDEAYQLSYRGVQDTTGNRKNEDITFTVAPDTTAPTVVSFSPNDGNSSTPIDSNLTIVFDKNVQKGTGDIVIKRDSDDSIVEEIDIPGDRVTISNNTVTIDPTDDFDFNTKYYVTIDGGVIKDKANTPNNYAGITTKGDWDFTTFAKLSLSSLESANITYTEGDGNVSITSLITVLNPSDEDIVGAKVAISNNFISSEDVLHFTDQNGISGDFNSLTGLLSLSGTADISDYQTALRSITYKNSNTENPNATNRVLNLNITDSKATSTTVQRTIEITATNDAPTLNPIANITKNANFNGFNISLIGVNDVEMDDLNISFETNDTSIIQLSKNWDNSMGYANYFGGEFNLTVSSEANQSGVTEVNLTISDGVATIYREFNITVMDTIPDSFNFTDKTAQARSTVIESNSVEIKGIDNDTPISITDGEYSINGGAWTDANGTVDSNDNVTVRLTSSSSYSTTSTATLKIGDTTESFSVITESAPYVAPEEEPTAETPSNDTIIGGDGDKDETTAKFDESMDVNIDKTDDITTATMQVEDKKIAVAVHDSGTMEGKIESTDKDGNLVASSIKVAIPKSETSVDAKGNMHTTVETDSGATIKSTLAIDGSVKQEIRTKNGVTVTTSAIPGSKVEIDKEGNVQTTSTVEKNGVIYKAVATTDADGKTQTKFVQIDVATGEEKEIKSTKTPYSAGSTTEIMELNDLIYIKTTTPLDGALVID